MQNLEVSRRQHCFSRPLNAKTKHKEYETNELSLDYRICRGKSGSTRAAKTIKKKKERSNHTVL